MKNEQNKEIAVTLDDQGDPVEIIQKVIEKEPKNDTDNYYVIWADKEGLLMEGYLTEEFAIQKYLEVSSKIPEEKGPIIIKGKVAEVEIVTKLSF
jgi:hypothetical protein